MSNYIYVLTDCNRTCLHVGMTDSLQKAVNTYKELSGIFLDTCAKVSRLVYHETLPTEEAAARRFKELTRYTRMQKEKLIRKHNPNWSDLGSVRPLHSARPTTLLNTSLRP
ncbi:nuclease [Parapedobacter pyrenivorans]|uniref:Nuclease n=1 Tax=Parapedobacter pyrenivorans TaxID=1305674 RepID=A0A917MA44_9SPHI|nr:GIY-YIG nuclease family protein [Parapedobacter pyrenivorans]GGG88740.1 nuclease [Parapedobacter pyrenivorans]